MINPSTATNPDFKERIERFLERQYFMKHIGFSLNVIEPGKVEGWLDLGQIHQQQHGKVHGGVTSTIADIVAGFAAYTLVDETQNVVTIELKVSYLNPGIGDKLHAIGWVLKKGSRMHFCEAEVWAVSENERTLIAKATTTMALI
jgi:uncharacterized protein (TIGR00369 family)